MKTYNRSWVWPISMAMAPVAIMVAIMVAGCSAPRSSADLERQEDCTRQADQEFNKQNRYQLSEEDQSSTPFSSSGLIGIPNKGLSDQYHRDRLVDDCMHSAVGNEPTTLPGNR